MEGDYILSNRIDAEIRDNITLDLYGCELTYEDSFSDHAFGPARNPDKLVSNWVVLGGTINGNSENNSSFWSTGTFWSPIGDDGVESNYHNNICIKDTTFYNLASKGCQVTANDAKISNVTVERWGGNVGFAVDGNQAQTIGCVAKNPWDNPDFNSISGISIENSDYCRIVGSHVEGINIKTNSAAYVMTAGAGTILVGCTANDIDADLGEVLSVAKTEDVTVSVLVARNVANGSQAVRVNEASDITLSGAHAAGDWRIIDSSDVTVSGGRSGSMDLEERDNQPLGPVTLSDVQIDNGIEFNENTDDVVNRLTVDKCRVYDTISFSSMDLADGPVFVTDSLVSPDSAANAVVGFPDNSVVKDNEIIGNQSTETGYQGIRSNLGGADLRFIGNYISEFGGNAIRDDMGNDHQIESNTFGTNSFAASSAHIRVHGDAGRHILNNRFIGSASDDVGIDADGIVIRENEINNGLISSPNLMCTLATTGGSQA